MILGESFRSFSEMNAYPQLSCFFTNDPLPRIYQTTSCSLQLRWKLGRSRQLITGLLFSGNNSEEGCKMSNLALLGFSRYFRLVTTQSMLHGRLISTSGKNRETATVAENVEKEEATDCKVKKNWVSYGFDTKDETEDRNAMHAAMFGSITLCMVFGGFFWAYAPDFKMMNWAQREAFLELRRREALGVPPVDKDFIPANKIVLPSDEELGETEIII